MRSIDLNCDMGESTAAQLVGNDAAIMPFISSASIACGFHAGDPLVMERTVRLAIQHGVVIGAHPGYRDPQNFGRRELLLPAEEVEALIIYQLGALSGMCHANGVEMVYVKPHGALYNQAARDRKIADSIVRSVVRFDKRLKIFALAGSALLEAGRQAGLTAVAEGFPDRAYEPDGSLRSRKLPNAIIEDPMQVVEHGLRMAQEGVTAIVNGKPQTWKVHTLCIHGDSPRAFENASVLRKKLEEVGFIIKYN